MKKAAFLPDARVLCATCFVDADRNPRWCGCSRPIFSEDATEVDPILVARCDACGAEAVLDRDDVARLARLRDAIQGRLSEIGLKCGLDQTGGMCVALYVGRRGDGPHLYVFVDDETDELVVVRYESPDQEEAGEAAWPITGPEDATLWLRAEELK